MNIFPKNNNFFEHLSLYYIAKIWNLWELVILETPLVIAADSPTVCSEVAILLSNITFPLQYLGDIRPYFTIYDSDFKDYKDDSKLIVSNSPILGFINPICLQTFKELTTLHLDDLYFNDLNILNPIKNINKNNLYSEVGLSGVKRKFSLNTNGIKALITVFNKYVEEKKIDKINMLLRMHLIELNNDFMRTFEDYFFSHEIKNIQRIAFFKKNFSIFEIFEESKFLKYLQNINVYFNSKYIKDKKKTLDLYANFLKTKCFKEYLKNIL